MSALWKSITLVAVILFSSGHAQSGRQVKMVLQGQEISFDADAAVFASFDYDDSVHPMRLIVKDNSMLLGLDGKRLMPGTVALTWSEEYKKIFRNGSTKYRPGQIEEVAIRFGKDTLVINKKNIADLEYVDNGLGKPLTVIVPAHINLYDHDKNIIAVRTGSTFRDNEEFRKNFMSLAKPHEAKRVDPTPDGPEPDGPEQAAPAPRVFVAAINVEGDNTYEEFDFIRSVKIAGVHGFDEDAVYWVRGENAKTGVIYLQKVPNGPIQGISANVSRNKTIMVPYEHPTRLTKSLTTAGNMKIMAGSIVQEVAHDGDSVQVKLTGDPNGTLYTISKSTFLNGIEPVRDFAALKAQAAKLGGSAELSFENFRVLGNADGKEYPPMVGGEHAPRVRLRGGEEIEIIGDGLGSDKKMYLARKKLDPPGTPFLIAERELTDSEYFRTMQADTSDEVAEALGLVTPLSNLSGPEGQVEEVAPPTEAHQSPASSSKMGLGRFVGDTSRATLSSAECQPWSDYSPKQQSQWRGGRSLYRAAIVAAANAHSIDPAVLETSIQVETDFRDNVENETEVAEIIANLKASSKRKNIGYADAVAYVLGKNSKKKPLEQWGKGPAQIGPACAARLGLKWDVEKPMPFPPTEKYKRDNPKSVYIPEVALMAQAQLFKEEMQKERTFTDSNGKVWDLRSHMFGRGVAETSRNLLAMWNRGEPRVMQSYKTYIETSIRRVPPRTRVLPDHFGQLWSTRSRNGESVLHRQKINRRHVYYGAGLCGDVDPKSLMARFQKEYEFSNGKWASVKD